MIFTQTEKEMQREVENGDIIILPDDTRYEIAKVLTQHYVELDAEQSGWDIEFVNAKGVYQHYNFMDSGGTVVSRSRLFEDSLKPMTIHGLTVTGASLISYEAVNGLSEETCNLTDWWWTRSKGASGKMVAYVPGANRGGAVSAFTAKLGVIADNVQGTIRPVLKLTDFEKSGYKVGDTFQIGDYCFDIISESEALSRQGISQGPFRSNWQARNANDYEFSDARVVVEDWYHKTLYPVYEQNRENYRQTVTSVDDALVDRILPQIKQEICKDSAVKKNQAVIFLGGQPGAGKSSFYSMDDSLDDYVIIDGDRYRKYHPDYAAFSQEELPNATQPFVNKIVERLIDDLGKDGYNMVIEGTLRDSSVPIQTACKLKEYGYHTKLFVMAVDACTSWESTLHRAELMKQVGQIPRTVPFQKYDAIVQSLPDNLVMIHEAACMDSIYLLNRENEILWNSDRENEKGLHEVFAESLNLDSWNRKKQEYLPPGEEIQQMQQEGEERVP